MTYQPIQSSSAAVYLENVPIYPRYYQQSGILAEQVAGVDGVYITAQLNHCMTKQIEREG